MADYSTIEDLLAVLTSSEATADIYLGGIAAVHASVYTIKDCHVMISGDHGRKHHSLSSGNSIRMR